MSHDKTTMMTELDWFNHLKIAIAPGETLLHDTFFDPNSRQVMTCDMLVEGTHFERNWGTPYQLGYKARAVNLSDLAATAAKPQWALISIGIPPLTPDQDIIDLYQGLKTCANLYRCQIIGGDTCKSDKLTINITVLGYVPMGSAVGRRNTAQAGELIALCGYPGLAALGLLCCKNHLEEYPLSLKQFLTPEPQLTLTNQIARLSDKLCAMDTSDGLADALIKLAQASHKDLIVDSSLIPIHPEIASYAKHNKTNPLEMALYGGEDYGILLCLPQALATLYEPLKVIGSVQTAKENLGRALIKTKDSLSTLNFEKCYQHFEPKKIEKNPEEVSL